MINIKCKECSILFEKINNNQKFCSAKCQKKNWKKNNQEKSKEYRKKSYYKLKKYKYCGTCNKIIGKNKKKFCSDDCYKIHKTKEKRLYWEKCKNYLDRWKLDRRCEICGYHKCPVVLEFHHKYGKDFNIGATWFYQLSEKTKKELEKCILVCSNCHKELHYYNKYVESSSVGGFCMI